MDRSKFFHKVVIDNQEEYDFLWNSLNRFKMTYPTDYYRIHEDDLMRPDLISYKVYGTEKYWWLICYVNKILSPLTDLEVGELLTIPNLLDIYEFYKNYGSK